MADKVKPGVTGDVWTDMGAMHTHYGFSPDQRGPISRKHLQHRLEFIREELTETIGAFNTSNPAGLIDGLIDLIVVAAGTLDLLGVDSRQAWIEVMTANMNKEVGMKESRPNSDGMDLVKPEGWKPPSMARFVTKFLSDSLNIEWDQIAKSRQEKKKEDRMVVKIFQSCIDLFRNKSDDYNFPGSTVMPADYYPNGIDDLVYMIDVLKRNRQISIIDKIRAGGEPNFDSLEDIMFDRMVYLAIAIEWLRGATPGQDPRCDMFGKDRTVIVKWEPQDNGGVGVVDER